MLRFEESFDQEVHSLGQWLELWLLFCFLVVIKGNGLSGGILAKAMDEVSGEFKV